MPLIVRASGCGSTSERRRPRPGCGRCEWESARRCPEARRQVQTEAHLPSRLRARRADNRLRPIRHLALHGNSPGSSSRRRQSKNSARSADPGVDPSVARSQDADHRRTKGELRPGWLVSDGLGACSNQYPGSPRRAVYKPRYRDSTPARVGHLPQLHRQH